MSTESEKREREKNNKWNTEGKDGKLQRGKMEAVASESRSSQDHKNYQQQKVTVDKRSGNNETLEKKTRRASSLKANRISVALDDTM